MSRSDDGFELFSKLDPQVISAHTGVNWSGNGYTRRCFINLSSATSFLVPLPLYYSAAFLGLQASQHLAGFIPRSSALGQRRAPGPRAGPRCAASVPAAAASFPLSRDPHLVFVCPRGTHRSPFAARCCSRAGCGARWERALGPSRSPGLASVSDSVLALFLLCHITNLGDAAANVRSLRVSHTLLCSPSCRARTSPTAGGSTMSTAPSRATSRSSIT